jgi:quinol-cytochrome oxidoreductase complex cytochrome b subunit
MNRLWTRGLGIGLSVAATASAVVGGNAIGAVAFGIVTLAVVWFAVCPTSDPSATMHPLRGNVVIAAGFTVVAAIMVAAAMTAEEAPARGLAIVAAIYGVPGALVFWWFTYRLWQQSWRWSSGTTRDEVESARGAGRRVAPPSADAR